MNFLAVTESALAFCGRQYLHLYYLKSEKELTNRTTPKHEYASSDKIVSLDLHLYLPPGKINLERVSAICCDLYSADELGPRYLCAADSEKNVFVFECAHRVWQHVASFTLGKRVLKVQFDLYAENLIIVDKCGDVLVSSMETPEAVTRPRRIPGLSALTLDTILSLNNHQMLTCDGQIKIFVTQFPEPKETKAYSFGRAETIANIALFNRDQHLITVGGDGTLKIWDMFDHRCVKTFNLFRVMFGVKYKEKENEDTEVKRLRLSEAFGYTYFAIKIFGYKELPVFQLIAQDYMIRHLGQVKMESEFCDFGWYDNVLFTYNPETNGVIRRFTVTPAGVLCDANFQIPHLNELRFDFRGFVTFMNTTLSLRKHFSSDLIRLSQDQKLMDEFIAAAEKKIPKLVRKSCSGADCMLETDAENKSILRKVANALENIAVDEKPQAGTSTPVPGPSKHVEFKTEAPREENAYLKALNYYPRLREVKHSVNTKATGRSRFLEHLLRKGKLSAAQSTVSNLSADSDDDADADDNTDAREPSMTGRTRSRSAKRTGPYDPVIEEKPAKTIEPIDPKIRELSKQTSKAFFETLMIPRPKPALPTGLIHIDVTASKPTGQGANDVPISK